MFPPLRLHQQVLCSRADDYSGRGVLCDAQHEGPLTRNPGNHNRDVVERLPTSAEVEFTLSLADYDTGAMDRSANMSFRNTLEGQISLTANTHTHIHTRLTLHCSILTFTQLCLYVLPMCGLLLRTLVCGLKQHTHLVYLHYNRRMGILSRLIKTHSLTSQVGFNNASWHLGHSKNPDK